MSRCVRQFLILRTWVDRQFELAEQGRAVHPHFSEQYARLRREGAYLICIGIDGGYR